jgi:hypothetical protein
MLQTLNRIDDRAKALLDEDLELLNVIKEAVQELQIIFENVQIELDYFEDHEDETPISYVRISVLPQLDMKTAHKLMKTFDNRWLLDNISRAGGRFGVDIYPLL